MEPAFGNATIVAIAERNMAQTRIGDRVVAWAKQERGISRATLELLGVGSGTTFYPDLKAKSEGIFFPYRDGWKSRAVPQKAFVASPGVKFHFWNLDIVLRASPSRVYITEGEMDAAALVEAGISADCVLSVPSGARVHAVDDAKGERGYQYVMDGLKEGLSRVKEFVFCGDADQPGKVLREDMAHLLGIGRFRFVDWPEGIKDANEMLVKDGPESLRSLVQEGSLPWPIEGAFKLSELPEPPSMVLWNPGFPEWESKIKLAPRTLSVVTGHPGHGKTVLFNQIWFNVLRQTGVRMAVASFETRPIPHLRRQLRSLISGKLERDMSLDEKHAADSWIEDHYVFLNHPSSRPTFEWFMRTAEAAVIRYGCRIIQIDPWNRLEGNREHGESETDYIGRCLRSLYTFATDMNCHVQVIAHPAKMDPQHRTSAPSLSDCSGSKHWDNMPDQGFVVHRPKMSEGKERSTDAILYHRKARFEELGYPCKLDLRYDLATGKFVSTDYEL